MKEEEKRLEDCRTLLDAVRDHLEHLHTTRGPSSFEYYVFTDHIQSLEQQIADIEIKMVQDA